MVNKPSELQESHIAENLERQIDTKRPLFSVLALCLIFLVFFALVFALQHKGFNSAMVYDGAALIYNNADKFAERDPVKIMKLVPGTPVIHAEHLRQLLAVRSGTLLFPNRQHHFSRCWRSCSRFALHDHFRDPGSEVTRHAA